MKKIFPTPLTVDCAGLNRFVVRDLADKLSMYFEGVETLNNTITLTKPLDEKRYHSGWRTLDYFSRKYKIEVRY